MLSVYSGQISGKFKQFYLWLVKLQILTDNSAVPTNKEWPFIPLPCPALPPPPQPVEFFVVQIFLLNFLLNVLRCQNDAA